MYSSACRWIQVSMPNNCASLCATIPCAVQVVHQLGRRKIGYWLPYHARSHTTRPQLRDTRILRRVRVVLQQSARGDKPLLRQSLRRHLREILTCCFEERDELTCVCVIVLYSYRMYHAYLVRVTNMQLDLTRAQKKLSIASFNLLHNRRNC